MPQSFRFNAKCEDQSESVACDFPDDEWTLLTEFAKYADDLESSDLMARGINVQLVIHGDMKTKRLTHEYTLPSDDEVAILLHRLRPFVLNKERTHFGRVCNILKRRIPLANIRSMIEDQQREFFGKNTQEQAAIRINDQIVNSEQTLMKWLNAYEYHRDPELQKELTALRDWFPDRFSKGIFVSMLLDKARAVMNIGGFICWMDRRDGGEFRCRVPVKDGPDTQTPPSAASADSGA